MTKNCFMNSRTSSHQLKERGIARLKTEEVRTLYEFKEVVGKGRFGMVVHAVDKASGMHRAIKILNKNVTTPSCMQMAEREIQILRMVNHPNIILLDKVVESQKKLYLVFELCRCRLADVFRKKKIFPEHDTKCVMNGLSNAVAYLHQYEIVHRDLKLENVLLANNPNDPRDKLFIKVIDFGLSVVKGGVGYVNMLQDMCGTLTYMAPEIVAERAYGRQCDVWAMGIIMYLLLSGRFPFYSKDETQLCNLIKNSEPRFSEQAWRETVSEDAVALVRKLLTKNPAYRITAAELVSYPWINNEKADDTRHTNVLEMMQLWRQDCLIRNGESPGREIITETAKVPKHRNQEPNVSENSKFGVEKKSVNMRQCHLHQNEEDPVVNLRNKNKHKFHVTKFLNSRSTSPGTSGTRYRSSQENREK